MSYYKVTQSHAYWTFCFFDINRTYVKQKLDDYDWTTLDYSSMLPQPVRRPELSFVHDLWQSGVSANASSVQLNNSSIRIDEPRNLQRSRGPTTAPQGYLGSARYHEKFESSS